VNFGYLCGQDFVGWNARALYTAEEVQLAWNGIIEKVGVKEQGVHVQKLLEFFTTVLVSKKVV
jgi:hypothetical protein